MKIFCSECKSFSMGSCYNKNNMKPTPIARAIVDKSAEELNKNNDCAWFMNERFWQNDWFIFFLISVSIIACFIYVLVSAMGK